MGVVILASVLMLSSGFWFVPPIGGALCVLGITLERKNMIDLGVMAAAFTYFLSIYYVEFTLTNLLLILGMYFLFFIIWILDRQAALSRRLKLENEKDYDSEEIMSFEVGSALYLGTTVIGAFFISFVGAQIALYSSLGLENIGYYSVPLAVIFALSFLFIVYLIFHLLPKYIDVLEE